jgi:hypothetical protein
VLELTRATQFVPASNVRGEVAGASWVFALPRLEFDRIVCFGAPARASLAMLDRLVREHMILYADPRAAASLVRANAALGLRNVEVRVGSLSAGELGPVDLCLWLQCGGGPDAAARLAMLRQSLRPGSVVYIEARGRRMQPTVSRTLAHLAEMGWKHVLPLALTPSRGELRSLAPAGDATTWRDFARHARHGLEFPWPGVRRLERAWQRAGGASPLRRHGFIVGDAASGVSLAPPRYVCDIAKQAGVDVHAHRWGVWARGDYDSQKAILYLYPSDAPVPDVAVKLTRGRTFNRRLENEADMLARLQRLPARRMAPALRFAGPAGAFFAVGEAAVDGPLFEQRTSADAGCALLAQALDTLTALGEQTAIPAAPRMHAEALRDLLERYRALYAPPAAEAAFLAEQIAALAQLDCQLPLVLQHGDPGAWNAVVSAGDQLVFLDWEAGEANGMPLWDLFYFARSFAVIAGRRRGEQRRLHAIARGWFEEGALAARLAAAVATYCKRVGVPVAAVEPLYHTCWMHRALKEATRLQPEALARGHYRRLLALGIERRAVPGLQQTLRGGAMAGPESAATSRGEIS